MFALPRAGALQAPPTLSNLGHETKGQWQFTEALGSVPPLRGVEKTYPRGKAALKSKWEKFGMHLNVFEIVIPIKICEFLACF